MGRRVGNRCRKTGKQHFPKVAAQCNDASGHIVILVVNTGSSSLKFQLIDMDDESVKAKGLVERIGIEGKMCIRDRLKGADR